MGSNLLRAARLAEIARNACDAALDQALKVVRLHLGMDVAYISEFVDELSILRRVHAPGLEPLIRAGASYRLDETYCRHILDGRLSDFIADTTTDPFAMSLKVTTDLPIGAHVGAPIILADGTYYGMLCCFSLHPKPTLDRNGRDVLRFFANFAAVEIDREQATVREGRDKRNRIEAVLEGSGPQMVFQPICSVERPDRVVGYEALSRFAGAKARTPDVWFAEADEIGRLVDLEVAAVCNAGAAMRELPDGPFVAVNVSARSATSRRLLKCLEPLPLDRVVLEITEAAPIDDYDEILGHLAPLRRRGLRLAIDDAGAGYAGLKHILMLRPDFLKLDASLTRDLDTDRVRQALVGALVDFASKTGSTVIAEGIETPGEFQALGEIGVPLAQGYLLGRPMPREAVAVSPLLAAAPFGARA